jgi:hypothetical protein
MAKCKPNPTIMYKPTAEDRAVAIDIYKALGGTNIVAATGASAFVVGRRALSFSIPAENREKVTGVTVVMLRSGKFDVLFRGPRGSKGVERIIEEGLADETTASLANSIVMFVGVGVAQNTFETGVENA